MHAQETLASSAAFAGLTGSIPIEGDRPRSRICGPKTTDGRAIQAEWASCVGRVQGAAKRGQITNALKRKRSTPHPLELAGTERRPGLIARSSSSPSRSNCAGSAGTGEGDRGEAVLADRATAGSALGAATLGVADCALPERRVSGFSQHTTPHTTTIRRDECRHAAALSRRHGSRRSAAERNDNGALPGDAGSALVIA